MVLKRRESYRILSAQADRGETYAPRGHVRENSVRACEERRLLKASPDSSFTLSDSAVLIFRENHSEDKW